MTPHVLVGTTTVTGASGSPPLAAAMARAELVERLGGADGEVVSVTGRSYGRGVTAGQPDGARRFGAGAEIA